MREADDDVLLLRQVDHAALSGELAARLADAPPPLGALIAAARAHDNGWRETDDSPLLDEETGLPHAYMGFPDAPYRELWDRGMARAEDLNPYVGLLVALHGARFFERGNTPEDQAFFRRARGRIDALLAALALGGSYDALPEPASTHAQWIRFLDGLSLFACERWESPWRAATPVGDVRVERREAGTIATTPWLFGEPFAVDVPARVLPGATRFDDEPQMRAAIAAAPVRALRFSFDITG